MWNDLYLECPTEDLCQYDIQETAILQEFPTLVNILETSSEVLKHDQPIWQEMQVFHNVREKYRRILHSDKCLLLLQRVGTCLKKIALLNISKTYLDLAGFFQVNLQSQSSPIYLPSCQQLEYVLLRTQSASKLICELLYYSKEAFCHLIQKLRMGHLILNLTMALSVTARVNMLFRNILVQIFDIYKKLYIWLGKLKKGITQWPKPLDLPEDLEIWLNTEASDLLRPKEVTKSQVAFLCSFFEKQEDDAVPVKIDKVNDEECVIIGETQSQIENPDVGEVIPRPKKRKKINPLLDKIQNIDSLKSLMNVWRDLYTRPKTLMKEPSRRKLINQICLAAEKKLKKIEHKDLPLDIKEEQNSAVFRSTGNLLAEHLGLIHTKKQNKKDTKKQNKKDTKKQNKKDTKKQNKKVEQKDLPFDIKEEQISDVEQSTENLHAEHLQLMDTKKQHKKIECKDLPFDVKKDQNSVVLRSTGNLLDEHLGLIDTESASNSVLPVEELKPVKKLKELRILYNTLHQMLQSTQLSEECDELEKKFKLRRADVKRLIKNDEKKIARELIFITSKEFLTRFKKPSVSSISAASSSTIQSMDELKPAKTLKELKIHYDALCQMFQSTQQYAKLTTLKKKFKRKKKVIMHFISNNQGKKAKKLILCASKEFLEMNFFRK